MRIPDTYRRILERDQHYLGVVNLTLSQYEQFINRRTPEFFPDYTEHGTEHIEKVLDTTAWLMKNDTVRLLSEKDIAVLVLAVLLHDYGMFITRDGLLTLLRSERMIHELDDKSWSRLWEDYRSEVRRWDEKQQINVCGRRLETTDITLDGDLKDSTKKIIGEFLRRHHPRLAHEIARFGFPGTNDARIDFAFRLEPDLKDIIGFIARSHGQSLRGTLPYLRDQYRNVRDPFGVKAVFHMVLLRIADYLQITSERAPRSKLLIQSISSPFSQLQWNIHNSIKYTTNNSTDPELLFIEAAPSNVNEYLELQKLFTGIQDELDRSWAVLGELYGENMELSKLKIRLRRISSNIEEKQYISNLQYVPRKVAFESHPDVLKLLIQPLYGNNPSYGVRELLQNAIDACRENAAIKHVNDNYEPLIKIAIEEKGNEGTYFVISDNGVGMSEDVVINYFLRAGSTYRRSYRWKQNFLDDEGNSIVQRSGRFGVGVLAAFLLGEEIDVETRMDGSEYGLHFLARLEDETVEIRKSKETSEGTSIRIKIKEDVNRMLENEFLSVYEGVSWTMWYQFNYPSIQVIDPSGWIHKHERLEINKETSQIRGWYSLESELFDAINWKYVNNESLICNGFYISRKTLVDNFTYPSFSKVPSISVIDSNGNLPLTLARNQIYGYLPFGEDLAREVCKQIIWRLLTLPEGIYEGGRIVNIKDYTMLKYEAFAERDESMGMLKWGEGDLLFKKNGYILPHSYCLGKLSFIKMIVILGEEKEAEQLVLWDNDDSVYAILGARYNYKGDPMTEQLYNFRIGFDSRNYDFHRKLIYIPTIVLDSLYASENGISSEFLEAVAIERINNEWSCIKVGDPSLGGTFTNINNNSIDQVVEYYLSEYPEDNERSDYMDPITPLLEYYLGDNVIIPYSLAERKKRFPKVFDELYIYD